MSRAHFLSILGLLLPLLACGGGGTATTEAPPQKGWGTATLIETNNAGGVADPPRIAVLPNGDAFSIWSQSDGTRLNIWGNKFTSGSGWGSAVLLETHNEGDATSPQLSVNASGMATATWAQDDGTYFNIWSNRYTPGSGWGTALQIESHGTGYSSDPHVAMDSTGNATVVWREDRLNGGGDTDIWTNRYTVGGGWGTATLLETDDSISVDSPRIAMDASGQATAIWDQNSGSNTAILAKHASASGTWGGVEIIKSLSSSYLEATSLGVDGPGQALVLWSQSNGTTYHIQASSFTSGSGWSAPQTVDTDTHNAYSPSIAMDGSGNAMAVWSQSDGTRNNILASRLSSTTGWGAPTLIETDNAGYANRAQVAMDASGLAFAVWTQSDGTRNNIWSNRFQLSTGWESPTLLETDNAGDATNPSIGMDGNGHALAVWSQTDGTRYNGWANRYR